MSHEDPRRRIPRTDTLLAMPELAPLRERLSETEVRSAVENAQDRARAGEIAPEDVAATVIGTLSSRRATSLRPVLNATGVVVHTNLGRAPYSQAARQAVMDAAGYVDVELDLSSGQRSRRGTATREALLRACPAAQDAMVVNNGAGALVLATTAFAAGCEVVISRGQFVEIGAGFRLSDLMESTGARLREVGTTNRTHAEDYARALGPRTGCILSVHPSNFRVSGFTSQVPVPELRALADEHRVPLVVDVGSGLLTPDPALPDEPSLAEALEAGADVVIASGDKLLGGPQAGLLLGRTEAIRSLSTHPLARAVRADKLTLAALEATLTGGPTPVHRALHADPESLRVRTERLARQVGGEVVPHDGRVGGGGAPGVPLHGWAVRLPDALAPVLREGDPAVLPRVHDGACLLDLRCIPEADDAALTAAVQRALAAVDSGDGAADARTSHRARGSATSGRGAGRRSGQGDRSDVEHGPVMS